MTSAQHPRHPVTWCLPVLSSGTLAMISSRFLLFTTRLFYPRLLHSPWSLAREDFFSFMWLARIYIYIYIYIYMHANLWNSNRHCRDVRMSQIVGKISARSADYIPHKGPIMRKAFPYHDVIIFWINCKALQAHLTGGNSCRFPKITGPHLNIKNRFIYGVSRPSYLYNGNPYTGIRHLCFETTPWPLLQPH